MLELPHEDDRSFDRVTVLVDVEPAARERNGRPHGRPPRAGDRPALPARAVAARPRRRGHAARAGSTGCSPATSTCSRLQRRRTRFRPATGWSTLATPIGMLLGDRDHRRQPVRLLAADRARRGHRPRGGDAEAAPHAVGGHYVRLYAPRKYGKTSLLGRVLRDGERSEGLIPITVDLYGVLSIADVTVRIERAYARQLKGKRARADRGVPAEHRPRPLARRVRGQRAAPDRPEDRPAAGPARAARPAAAARGGRRLPGADRLRRVPGHRQGARARRDPPQPHPVPGRRRLVRLRRLGARDDGAALRVADRPLYGSAVPMRLERLARRGHRRLRRRPLPRDAAAASATRSTRSSQTADGHPAARDPARAPALGGGRAEGDTATLQDWRRGARSGAARARGPSSTRTGGASARPSRRRCARSSAAAALRSSSRVLDAARSSTRRRRTRRCAGSPRRRTSRAPTARTGSSTLSSPSGSVGCATTPRN